MKLVFQILVIAILSFSATSVTAQSTSKAKKLYNRLGYQVSIPHFGDSEYLTDKELTKLANAYRLTGQTVEAEMLYRKIISRDSEPINYFYFAQALLMNDKVEESLEYFSKYKSLLTNSETDTRADSYIDFINSDVFGRQANIVVDNVKSLNTDNFEYSPAWHDNGLLFISSRPLSNQSTITASTYSDFISYDTKKDLWTEKDYNKIFFSQRDAENNLSEPVLFSKSLNGPLHQGPLHLNVNHDLLHFTSSHTLNGEKRRNSENVIPLQIYISVNTDDEWTPAIEFEAINTAEYNEAHPTLSRNGQTIIFASDRPGGYGGMDLYISRRKEGQWLAPVNLGADVNTPGNELFPYLHPSGKLYFSSDGHGGFGGLDIHHIGFQNDDIVKAAPVNAGYPINSNKDDFGYTSDLEDIKGYFSSSRAASIGRDDIYSFERGLEEDNEEEILVQEEIEESIEEVVSPTEEVMVDAIEETVPYTEAPLGSPTTTTTVPEPIIFEDKPVEEGFSITLDKIYYDFNKASLRSSSIPELNKLSDFLLKFPGVQIEVSAHTDARGKKDYNRELSQQRAEAVVAFLVQNNIASDRITAKGYGEDQLRNNCNDGVECTETEHQYNRRTEFKILGLGQQVNLNYTDNGPSTIDPRVPSSNHRSSSSTSNESSIKLNELLDRNGAMDISTMNDQLSTDGTYSISVGSYIDPAKKIRKMKALGFDKVHTSLIGGPDNLTAVLIGSTNDANTAKTLSKTITQLGVKNYVVQLD